MILSFDEAKGTQAAALLLRLSGKPMSYLALIKLLYKADREALRRWALPITTDKYVSIKHGPVLSRIYDRIKSSANKSAPPTFWSEHIQKDADPHKVRLAKDPGNSELSRAEENLLTEVFAADGAKDRFNLVEDCHRDFPEWTDPGNRSVPLDIREIIEALGLSKEQSDAVADQIEAQIASRSLAA